MPLADVVDLTLLRCELPLLLELLWCFELSNVEIISCEIMLLALGLKVGETAFDEPGTGAGADDKLRVDWLFGLNLHSALLHPLPLLFLLLLLSLLLLLYFGLKKESLPLNETHEGNDVISPSQ